MSSSWIGRRREDWLSQMHKMAEQRMAKESRHLSQPMTVHGVLCGHVCQTSVKHCCFTFHASCGCKNKRNEDTMLHFTDTLGIFPLLRYLMLLGHCDDGRGMVTRHVGVKYPDVNICVLLCVSESPCMDVQASIVINICRS